MNNKKYTLVIDSSRNRSGGAIVYIKNFIKHLTDVHDKEVVLLLPPYYLPSYKLTIEEKPFYLDLENKFRELSKETNIKIIGSYNASSNLCDDNEFYDYMHPKDSCMKKITNSIN